MAGSYQLILNGSPVDDDFYTKLSALEVEENVDLPGAVLLKLPISATDAGDLTFVTDDRLQPFATVAVVAQQESQDGQCIFDGVILSHKRERPQPDAAGDGHPVPAPTRAPERQAVPRRLPIESR